MELDQDHLASEAGVHLNTLRNLENDNVFSSDTLMAVQLALENRGIEFLEIAGRLGIILPIDLPEPKSAQFRAGRAALGLSRGDVAELAGVGPRTVAKVENADPTVRVGMVKACFDAMQELEVRFFEIEGREVVMLPPFAYLQALASTLTGETSD